MEIPKFSKTTTISTVVPKDIADQLSKLSKKGNYPSLSRFLSAILTRMVEEENLKIKKDLK